MAGYPACFKLDIQYTEVYPVAGYPACFKLDIQYTEVYPVAGYPACLISGPSLVYVFSFMFNLSLSEHFPPIFVLLGL